MAIFCHGLAACPIASAIVCIACGGSRWDREAPHPWAHADDDDASDAEDGGAAQDGSGELKLAEVQAILHDFGYNESDQCAAHRAARLRAARLQSRARPGAVAAGSELL